MNKQEKANNIKVLIQFYREIGLKSLAEKWLKKLDELEHDRAGFIVGEINKEIFHMRLKRQLKKPSFFQLKLF